MRLRDILSLAAHNLRESPLRTALCALSVAVGSGCTAAYPFHWSVWAKTSGRRFTDTRRQRFIGVHGKRTRGNDTLGRTGG